MKTDADRCVLRSGLVYSPRFPHSTAIIIEDGLISWVGDDDGLAGQGISDSSVVDCDEMFVGPAFFDAGRANIEDLPPYLAAALTATGPSIVAVRDQMGNIARATLAARSIDTAVALAGDRTRELGDERPLAYNSALCSDNPWQWIREQVVGESLSARAGFNAATRAGWRMVGAPESGEIIPGQVARLCAWRSEGVAVQAVDDRISRWSTDPRSGTPPLPRLDDAAALPTLALTIFGRSVTRFEL